MIEIVQKGNNVLSTVAKEVPIADIGKPKLKKILKDMKDALDSQGDGVAIAAPQIGVSLRIFVVAGKVFDKNFLENTPSLDIPQNKKDDLSHLVFINPKISKLSKEKKWVPEGCLSVRWLYGETHRSKKATVTAYDENGKKFTRGGSGLLAQIFQHETDHLNGILFVDHAKNLKEEHPHLQ
ncbi:peptide deformylase [Candidatus Nomurabacteria bacterium]|nr:peptide deformylase [Candidatus Nomurabacteria bacterium]